jgi:hypothetical protein
MEKVNRLIAKYAVLAGLGVMVVGILLASGNRASDNAGGISVTLLGLGLVIAGRKP